MSNKKGKGRRAKTRQKFKKRAGTLTIQHILADFKPGTSVHISREPSIHAGHTFRRFVGLTGTVIAKKGRTGVVVQFYDQNKQKQWTFTPAHLKAVKAPGEALKVKAQVAKAA